MSDIPGTGSSTPAEQPEPRISADHAAVLEAARQLPEDINEFARHFVDISTEFEITGYDLWIDFGNEFTAWNAQTFDLLDDSVRQTLAKFLKDNGILFQKTRSSRRAIELDNLRQKKDWSEQLALKRQRGLENPSQLLPPQQ